MNEQNQTNVPPPIAAIPPSLPPTPQPTPKPLSWWLRKIFACNPFYLVSAALLLYGCYRVSVDTPFLNLETARLLFSFSSVQAYEILLVLVAIFLARRSLWYDSTLLVVLENMLVFVPFILISQAALTDSQMTEAVCATGVMLAVLRFTGLKRYFTHINLSGPLLGVGFILLAVNVALPLVYRHYINFKLGVHLDSGPDNTMNECNWLLVLPAVLALVNFIPRPDKAGNFLPQHRWLPLGIFSLWFMVTGVHLYSLDYVYGYYLRSELFAPMAWVLAWTLFLRCPGSFVNWKRALMVPALLTPLLATSPGGVKTFLILSTLNIAGYIAVSFLNHSNRLAPHLAYASLLLLVAGLPDAWMQFIWPGLENAVCVWAGIAAYLIFWTGWLRNPKLAVVGAAILGYGVGGVLGRYPGATHWALQCAFVFLILHSLRWNDGEHAGATKARTLVLFGWAVESFLWMNSEAGRFWMPFLPGVIVAGIYCVYLPCRGIWRLATVPMASFIVMLSGPCSAMIDNVRSAPVGLLAVIASFLFLGFGTVVALTRHLWHKHEHERDGQWSTSALNR